MKIYVGHSTDIDFRKDLYEPLRESSIEDEYTLVFPHEDSDKIFDSRAFLRDECDLFIAEVSAASTGLGIEMGWADQFGVPVVCVHSKGSTPSSSLKAVTADIYAYRGSGELVEVVKKAVKRVN